MANEFNAGTIMGTLDIDRDPFTAGLDLAKAQAKEFEDNKIMAKVDVDAGDAFVKLDDLQMRADEVSGKDIHINTDVDDLDSILKLDELRVKIDELDHKDIKIDVDTTGLAEAKAEADAAQGSRSGGPNGLGFGMLGLVGAAIALGPALAPIAAQTVSLLAQFGDLFAIMGTGLAVFALAAKGDWSTMQTDIKAVATAQKELETATTTQAKTKALKDLAAANAALKGPVGQAVIAYQGFQKVWNDLVRGTSGPIFQIMANGFNFLRALVPQLLPILQGSINVFTVFSRQLSDAVAPGGALTKFFTFVAKFNAIDLTRAGDIFKNFFGGMGDLLLAFNPAAQLTLIALDHFSNVFHNWAASKQGTDAVEGFLGYIKKFGPDVSAALWGLEWALSAVFSGLAPLVGPALKLIADFGLAVGQIHLEILGKALGDLELALGPLLAPLGRLVDDLLPPLADIIEYILIPDIILLTGYLNALVSGNVFALVATGVGLVAAAMWALDAAIAANPAGALIDAILLSIVLLAAGIYELVTHWQAFVDFLNGPFGTAVSFVISIMFPLIGLPMELIGHWGLVGPFFKRAWADIQQWFGDAWKFCAGIIDDMKKWPTDVEHAWNDVSAFFRRIWTDIEGAFQSGWHTVSSFFTNMWNDITGAVSRGYNNVITWFQRLPGEIISILSPLPGKLEKWAEGIPGEIAYGLGFQLGLILDFFTKLLPAILTRLVNAKQWLIQKGVDMLTGMWSGMNTGMAAVNSFMAALPGRILKYVVSAGGWLLNAGTVLLHGMENGIVVGYQAVSGFFVALPGRIRGFVSAAGGWITTYGTALLHGFENGITSGYAAVSGFMSSLPGRVRSFVSAAGGWLTANGSAVMHGFLSGITTGATSVWSWFMGVQGNVGRFFGNAYNWVISSGKAVIDGFMGGLKQGWNDVTGWLGGVGSKFKAGLNAALHINSPSKITWQTGSDVIEGFLLGLNENWADIDQFFAKAASSVSAFSPAISSSAHMSVSATASGMAVQTAQLSALNGQLAGLRQDIQKLPTDTGKAVGDSVGKAFDKTSKDTVRATTVAARTNK